MPNPSRAPEPPPREGRVRESLAPLRGNGYGPRDPELVAVRKVIEQADPARLAYILSVVASRIRFGAR
jgi:hypothetical protein